METTILGSAGMNITLIAQIVNAIILVVLVYGVILAFRYLKKKSK